MRHILQFPSPMVAQREASKSLNIQVFRHPSKCPPSCRVLDLRPKLKNISGSTASLPRTVSPHMGKRVAVEQNIACPIILRKLTKMNFLFFYPSIPNLPDFARWLVCVDRWPKTKLGKGRGPSERLRSVCFQRPRGLIDDLLWRRRRLPEEVAGNGGSGGESRFAGLFSRLPRLRK